MGRSNCSDFWAGSSVRFKIHIGLDLMRVKIQTFEGCSSTYFLVSFSPFMIFVIVDCLKMMRCHLLLHVVGILDVK